MSKILPTDDVIVFESISKEYEIHDARSDVLRLAFTGKAKTTRRPALSNLSFRIKRGESVGIVGQNGAGKSTLLKLIAGTLKPSRGRMKVVGRVSAMLELGTGFNVMRTGRENVMTSGLCLGMSRAEVLENFDAIVAFAELERQIDQPVRTYSSGMMMRLAFAVATCIDPEIMIVDEAISVGDAKFQRKCFARFEEMRARGVTILLVTHWAQLVEMVCDRGIYLIGGKIAADGHPKDVVAQYNEDLFGASQSAAPAAPESSQEQRYGNGGVLIEKVTIVDQAGTPVNVLTPGEKFQVLVELECKQDEPVRGLNVGVSITTKEGVRLAAVDPTTTKQLVPELNRGDRMSVCVDMTNNLGVGDFFLTVGAWSRFSENHFDRRVDVAHFAVRGDFGLSQSLVDMRANYKFSVTHDVER